MSTDPSARYHCDNCKGDITSLVRIKCNVCANFDLCVDCFYVGVELRTEFTDAKGVSHINDHKVKKFNEI